MEKTWKLFKKRSYERKTSLALDLTEVILVGREAVRLPAVSEAIEFLHLA
jgi:hypothetical protein